MTLRPALLVAALTLGGCLPSAPEAAEQTYDRREGDAEYRVVQGTEGVLRIELRIRAGAGADLQVLEARCRRAIVAIGLAEAERSRMPPPHVVPERFVTASARGEPRDGQSRCTAEAPVFPAGGRGMGR